MKKHINLLHKNREYERTERQFSYLRHATMICGVVSFLLVLVLFFLQKSQESKYSDLLSDKSNGLKVLIDIKDMQQKVAYADDKTAYVKSVTKKDINFTPYYTQLKATLLDRLGNVASQSATIEDLRFDNKRDLTIKLNIYSDESLATFLSALESKAFIDLFQTVELSKFQSVSNGKYYEATVHGILKPVQSTIF